MTGDFRKTNFRRGIFYISLVLNKFSLSPVSLISPYFCNRERDCTVIETMAFLSKSMKDRTSLRYIKDLDQNWLWSPNYAWEVSN